MSFITDMKRIIRGGLTNFRRNGVVSFASVLVMTVTLFIVGSLLLANSLLGFLLGDLERKVDINIYFYPSAQETGIVSLQQKLESMPEVGSVTYVSREQALMEFTERHADDQLILQSLEELDVNPLGAVLNISATETSQYDAVAEFLESDEVVLVMGEANAIEKINYRQNKVVIDRLTRLTHAIQKTGIGLMLFFVVISVVIAFNTLRLGIFVSKEEISIMRLVGAENKYIRGPFLVEGIMYGIIATLITLVLLFAILRSVNEGLATFVGGFDAFNYFVQNFWSLSALLLASGIVLGIISSGIAVRRYLRT